MGKFDFVPDVLKNNGVDVLFEKIRVRPGKPVVFGVCEDGVCLGLPGNPVSSFVIFELLVRPLLCKMMGQDCKGRVVCVPLEETIKRRKTKRQNWIPVRITEAGTAELIEYHGSAHLGALCGADGLVSLDVGVSEIEKGSSVRVRMV